jgi:hypothetical protein
MKTLSFLHPQFARSKRRPDTRVDVALSRFDTTRVRWILLCSITVLSISYILLVNSSATFGFKIADLQHQVATLDQEYKQLLVAKTQAESLAELDVHVEETGLVPVTDRAYMHSTTSVLALLEEE